MLRSRNRLLLWPLFRALLQYAASGGLAAGSLAQKRDCAVVEGYGFKWLQPSIFYIQLTGDLNVWVTSGAPELTNSSSEETAQQKAAVSGALPRIERSNEERAPDEVRKTGMLYEFKM